MTDPHVLGDGLAPTPFTADEIRAGCPDGHRVLVRTVRTSERAGEPTFHVSGFEDGDAEGVTITSTPADTTGRPTGDARRTRVTWLDLQRHAAFPAADATVATERIRLEIGERDRLRYEVAGPEGVSTFWFALEHPGMPVRYATPGFAAETIAFPPASPETAPVHRVAPGERGRQT